MEESDPKRLASMSSYATGGPAKYPKASIPIMTGSLDKKRVVEDEDDGEKMIERETCLTDHESDT